MTNEEYTKFLNEITTNANSIMKTKNGKYSNGNDPLHNFHEGANISGMTTAQTAWGYATKHFIALRDMIHDNDFSDIKDVKEKCSDLINYIRFIYVIANEENISKGSNTSNNDTEPHIK